jgi:hypothetical protein
MVKMKSMSSVLGRSMSAFIALALLGCGGGSDASQDGPVVQDAEMVLEGFTTSTDVLSPDGTSTTSFAATFDLSWTARKITTYYLLVHVVPEGANVPDPTTSAGMVGKVNIYVNADGTLRNPDPLVVKCTVGAGGQGSTRRSIWCGGTSTTLWFDQGPYDLVAHVCDDYLPDAVQCAPPKKVTVAIR